MSLAKKQCTPADRWYYKLQSLRFAARALSQLIPDDWREHVFVPIPPSKIKGDKGHDPRLGEILTLIDPPLPDIREMILQKENTDSKQKGMGPSQRVQNYQIDETKAEREPRLVFLFDDVLTTGSHYKGAEAIIRQRFPGVAVCGLFLARAVRPESYSDVDLTI